jgi:RNA polymerase sigma-70 factor (ECF subfamily)
MISPIRALQAIKIQREPLDWSAVYTDQLPRVYNYFRYRVTDEALAEDLTSQTFEKAWRSRESYRQDLSGVSAWLFRIAQHVAVDYYRKKKPQVPLDEENALEDGPTPEENVDRTDALVRLESLLDGLSQREHNLIALKYGAEMNNREISRLVGLSESNVGTILCRVVKRLHSRWEESG